MLRYSLVIPNVEYQMWYTPQRDRLEIKAVFRSCRASNLIHTIALPFNACAYHCIPAVFTVRLHIQQSGACRSISSSHEQAVCSTANMAQLADLKAMLERVSNVLCSRASEKCRVACVS